MVLLLAAYIWWPRKEVIGPQTKPFAGTKLIIAVPDGPARLVIERHGFAWARDNEAKLELVRRPPGDAAGAVDIVVFASAEIGELLTSQQLTRVPADITGSGSWAGFSGLYRSKLLLWAGTAYALPIFGDASLVIYRADLFHAAGKAPPTTLNEFAEAAKTLADDRKKPILTPIDSDDRLDREFHSIAAALAVVPTTEKDLDQKKYSVEERTKFYSFQFDTITGQQRLTYPGFVAALEKLQLLQSYRSSAVSFVEAFRNDDAIIGLGTLADLAALKPATTLGRYGVAPIPAGPTGERIPYAGPGGYMAGVAKDSKQALAAWDLLQTLSSPKVSLEIVHDPSIGSAPFRGSHLIEAREGWFNYGLNEAATIRLREALTATLDSRVVNAPIRLRIPQQAAYRRTLLEGLRKALNEKVDPKKAMEDIAAQWDQLEKRTPKEQRLIEYLRSLNLKS